MNWTAKDKTRRRGARVTWDGIRNRFGVAIYRVQAHIGITPGEARAMFVVSLLLFGGVLTRRIHTALLLNANPVRFVAAADGPAIPPGPDERAAALRAAVPSGESQIPAGRQASSRARVDSASDRMIDHGHTLAAGAKTAQVRLDVNAATAVELQTLPGIGPAIADRIIEYRERYGAFVEVDELEAINGIGPKTLARLRKHVTTRAP